MTEALEIAAGCGGDVQLRSLTYRDLLLRGPQALDQRIDNAYAIDELAVQLRDSAAAYFGLAARATAHLERGELSLAEFAWNQARSRSRIFTKSGLSCFDISLSCFPGVW